LIKFCSETPTYDRATIKYGINYDIIFSWKEQILHVLDARKKQNLDDANTNRNIVEWVPRFTRALTFVTHAEFMTSLNTMTQLICNHIVDNRFTSVVLKVNDKDMGKSNFWVTVIVWKIIGRHVTHVFKRHSGH
jgi:hypothetical protein